MRELTENVMELTENVRELTGNVRELNVRELTVRNILRVQSE